MRRFMFVSVVFLCIGGALFAQADRLERFQANFASSNLQTKLEILRVADTEDPAAFGPLYGQALSFVVSNAEDLDSEPMLRELALVSIRRIEAGGYEPAVNDLWRLFRLYPETGTRIEVASVLSQLAGTSEQTITYIDQWVQTQNNLSRAGTRIDLQVLTAVIEALGEIASPSSFPAVIDTILAQHPDFVTDTALASLQELDGVPLEMATAVVLERDIPNRFAPFEFFMTADYLSEADRAELARVSLADTLQARPQEIAVQEEARRIRFAAADVLRDAEYSVATAAAIRHFNETVLEWERSRIAKTRLLEAIATLGAMGTEDAATRLTDYLELLNTYSEIDRPYDTQIMLAVIQNLEILDVPASYNALFYTTLLENYPSRVRDAAREAMQAVSQ